MAEEKASELSTKVRQGAVIRARGIRLVPLNARDKEVSRVKNASRLRVEFTLAGNDLAEPGERTVYVRITSPDGYVQSNASAATFEFEGERLTYTASRDVDYQNEDLAVGVYYNDGAGFTAGTYRVEGLCRRPPGRSERHRAAVRAGFVKAGADCACAGSAEVRRRRKDSTKRSGTICLQHEKRSRKAPFPLSARLPDGELTPLHPIVWNVRDEPYPDLLLLSGVRVGAETERLEITWNTVLFAFVFYVDVVVDFQLLRCRIGG